MKILAIPKFIFRVLRYIMLEFTRGYSLICLIVVFLTARKHRFYRKIGYFFRLDLWKISKGEL